jgi:hypothetical protein
MARPALLLPFLLAACGGPDFTGTFTGDFQGQAATFRLKEDGDRLQGTVAWAGVEAAVDGKVEGEKASGTVRHAATGLELRFEATLDEDRVDWVYTIDNPLGGPAQRVPLTLRREGAPKGGSSAKEGRDPRLVGRWVTEVGGDGVTGNTVTTRIPCVLNGDGSFEYGGGESLISLREYPGGPGSMGQTGPGAVQRGEWKSDGSVLYCKGQGGTWVPLGRYAFSGDSMVLYTEGGGKQLWTRS